jgi:general secretion pathway protein K
MNAMMQPDAASSSSQRGFVIVAVLWILVALSSLAMMFSVYLSASAHALAVGDTALRTEALVQASLELTAYQLTLAADKQPSRGSFHFRMDNADVNVRFLSEAARIDLNFAPAEVLAGLFAELGASKAAAKDDADRILGWRTRPTQGSGNDEEARYTTAGLDYSPRQSPFVHANEIALVIGLPPALVERALPFVTVFNGSPEVDTAIAAPEVLAALPRKNMNELDDAFGNRRASPADGATPTGSSVPPAPAGATASVKSRCFRIETTVQFNSGHQTSSEVVIVLGDRVEPYRIVSWQDDVEPPTILPLRGRR